MNLRDLSDETLLASLKALVRQEREDTTRVVEHLAEVDRRGLAVERGFRSLFAYCVEALGYSEPSAYHRIRAARAVQKRPELLELLRSGELQLRTIVHLHPYLENENIQDLVDQARGRSEREVSALLAPLSVRPESLDMIRVVAVPPRRASELPLFEHSAEDLFAAAPTMTEAAVAPPATPGELAPSTATLAAEASSTEAPSAADQDPAMSSAPARSTAGTSGTASETGANRTATHSGPVQPQMRIHVSFYADPSLAGLIQRAKEVLRHKHPQGRFEEMFEEALNALLASKDPDLWLPPVRHGESATRRIPKWVRHEVWQRDQGSCAYLSADGRRCGSRDGIEFDHVVPWALGGTSNDPRNIRLLCRAHNRHLARRAGLIKDDRDARPPPNLV